MKSSLFALLVCLSLCAAEKPIPPVPDKQPQPPFPATPAAATLRMLVPGFTVRELPVKLTSLNNLEYSPDGVLYAGGYDGRFHILKDTDGDGLEDKAITFHSEPASNYPIGIAFHNGMLHAVLTDEVVRFRDTDGDGIPDKRETVIQGFDDPAMVKAPYLNHRRVDSSLAIAFGPDDAMYITMGNAGYNNPYWHDKQGVAHYSTDQRRGCLLRIGTDGKVEQLNSGLRYIVSLQFNRLGDLFGTDQEGATWVPNGNPFDELLHLQPGRHYGFPPRQPRWLPDVVDEPSTWDYGPQHQSTCGFRFNGPAPGRGRFGPAQWADDAFVTAMSRGKLWRTSLAKTAAGYVARSQLIGGLDLLSVDCAISPQGDLVVACHSGKPDWGNGPNGEGRLYKISFTASETPMPVLAWPASETETVIAFDHPLPDGNIADTAAKAAFLSGHFRDAGDHLETFRPGYVVVNMQQAQKPLTIPIKAATLSSDRRQLHLTTATRRDAFNHTLQIPGRFSIAHDLSGATAAWKGADGSAWTGWLPHPDLAAAREFTRASAAHDALWPKLAQPGKLTLQTQLDLWRMLIPATQPMSVLGYEPDPETVTVRFESDAELSLDIPGLKPQRISATAASITVTAPKQNQWQAVTLVLSTPATRLDVSFTTTRDDLARPLALRRFQVPFARPPAPFEPVRIVPQIAGGDWKAGRALYHGKAACFTCHTIRGEGQAVGPDLTNQMHRDYNSVLNDLKKPSATLNPDALAYVVTQTSGVITTGTRHAETGDELQLAQPGGAIARIKKSDIKKTEPLPVSLMPEGIEKLLTPAELRDLMTFLLTEKP